MNVTLLTTRLFDVPASGGELCTARLLAALQQGGHRVRLIGRGHAGRPGRALAAVSLGPPVPAFDTLAPWQRAASLLGALASGRASTVQRLASSTVQQRLRRALLVPGEPAADALVVDHLQAWQWLAPLQAVLPGHLPAPLLVMHNLESDGYAEQAAAASGLRQQVLLREARLLARLEAQALQHSAAVACLSQPDAAVLRRRAGLDGPDVVVLPGYPLPPVVASDSTAVMVPQVSGRCIGLLGTWTWAPNRVALQWMLDQVLPRLPAHCHLLLAGAGLEGLDLNRARVRVLGRIDDPLAFYRAVQVVAVPSQGGSGVQEKAIEAIAHASAVVATPQALRGLGPGLPAHVHMASGAAEFAARCASVPSGAADLRAAATWASQRRAHYSEVLGWGLRISAASRR